jgi:hypothetical protein
MFGIRYVLFRQSTTPPPPEITPVFSGDDYWVLENKRALPRVFVPRSVETVADPRQRLQKMKAEEFDPRQVAYVEEPIDIPSSCRGTAKIVAEIPMRVSVAVEMETPGLVVFSDLWNRGWRAYLDGRPVPILRTNHAVRGVQVPQGKATIEFCYRPASLVWGLAISALAALALPVWLIIARKSGGGTT